jgi:Protein of unknown function (DUF1566)
MGVGVMRSRFSLARRTVLAIALLAGSLVVLASSAASGASAANAQAPPSVTNSPTWRRKKMRTTRKSAQGRLLRALTTTLVLALLAALLLAGSALAAATPGKPTAKAPKGTITQAKPTFKWSKAPRAAKYELRVYKGSKLLLKKTGIAKLSWKSSKALPKKVSLTWKVRARNSRGNSAWSKSLKFKVVTGSPAKAITAFSFSSPAATGTVTEAAHTIALTVPFGTTVSALVATFTTTGASVKVGSTLQTSGTTPNNFTSPLIYRVTAANASTQDYAVTVTVAANPAKAITAFSFSSPAVTGSINEAAHTIALTVPYGTNVSALVATFATTGASVAIAGTSQTSGMTADNFSNPVTYRVTAADASTQDYTVTVTVAANPAKAITAFSFSSPAVTGSINEAAHTIALTVPYGTNVSALAPSITITGASVSPASGVANNFTSPLIYRVTAANASTQDYAVTVTVAAAVIGQSYGGGKIAYILQSGDLGYSTLVTHGLIAAATDQSAGTVWAIPANQTTSVPGGTLTAIGTGSANTDKIIAQNGAGTYAAALARAYTDGVYTDWYLPSKDELNKLYLNRVAIGGFYTTTYPYYWSSSEVEYYVSDAWAQYFDGGFQAHNPKNLSNRVRAVRAF